jgi:hypothetical protein
MMLRCQRLAELRVTNAMESGLTDHLRELAELFSSEGQNTLLELPR